MICMRLMGGLGNQMFQYALGRRLAYERNTELLLDATYYDHVPTKVLHHVPRTYDLDVFNINARLLDPVQDSWLPCYSDAVAHHVKHALKRRLNLYEYFDGCRVLEASEPSALEADVFSIGRTCYLIGYWQNEQYFKIIDDLIRREFAFKTPFHTAVTDIAHEMANAHSLCLNVRRGDFVTNPFHGFSGVDYIYQALDRMRSLVDVDKIYVFSDEVNWCQENLRFDVAHEFVGHELAGRKFSSYLFLMTQCRHFIIPNSSFGWWAAWLARNPQKVVIAPSRWLNVPDVDMAGIIPQGWITI